jgi:hypothetical protein
MSQYLDFKFAHILIAIVGLGSGAATVLVAEPRVVRRLMYACVVPGYVLMLATGMWMGHIANLLDAHWTEAAMNLWGVGALFMALSLVALHRQVRLAEAGARASGAYRHSVLLGRLAGGGAALVILVILHFMVFKPA